MKLTNDNINSYLLLELFIDEKRKVSIPNMLIRVKGFTVPVITNIMIEDLEEKYKDLHDLLLYVDDNDKIYIYRDEEPKILIPTRLDTSVFEAII